MADTQEASTQICPSTISLYNPRVVRTKIMAMKKCLEAVFINHYGNVQMKVIITFCPHSPRSDILEVRASSTLSWTARKHEASGVSPI